MLISGVIHAELATWGNIFMPGTLPVSNAGPLVHADY